MIARDAHLSALRTTLSIGAAWITVSLAPSPATGQTSVPDLRTAVAETDEERDRAVHLLQRAAFGPTPESIESLLELGVEGWLDEQIDSGSIDDSEVSDLVAGRFPKALMSPQELLRLHPPGPIVQAARRLAQDSTTTEADRRQARQLLRANNPAQIVSDLTGARLTRAAHSERQLEEIMTQFWFDHFNVDFRKNQLRWLVGDYEATAIRPNVFGSFYDLLVATASHPAMLAYLDNAQSVAPDSVRTMAQTQGPGPVDMRGRAGGPGTMPPQLGPRRPGVPFGVDPRRRRMQDPRADMNDALPQQRPGRDRGLNENYARELLELHTVGVDGGYDQEDVVEVARAFTGWGISTPAFDRAVLQRMGGSEAAPSIDDIATLIESASYEGAFEFSFRAPLHDPFDKVVLGETIEGSRGMDDALEVLETLATHPATARHVATQLVTRFVSDDPPAEMVDEIARVFLDTDGDLAEVTKALFTSPHFFADEFRGTKVKSPFTLAASTVRATEAEVVDVRDVSQALEALGESPYRAEAPTGYPETSADWVSGGALLNRMEFGGMFASGQVGGLRPAPLGELNAGAGASAAAPTGASDDVVGALAERLFPTGDVAELVASVRQIVSEEGLSEPGEQARRALGLLLGSPEFQNH